MRKFVQKILGIIAVVGTIFTIQAFAFTEPVDAPPEGNVAAPINIGSTAQDKTGWLTFQGGGTRGDTYLATQNGNVGIGTTGPTQKLDVIGYVRGETGLCIGTDCRTSWPSGGGEDITGIATGTGILGGGTSGDVTISADTLYLQRRVSGTCAAGSSIRVISSTGPVTCETDDVGSGSGGTANYVSKWTAASTLRNSLIFDNGTNVGIGTAAPTQRL